MRIGVIGGGLVGLAVARRLALDGAEVTVFEKEPRVAAHQSGHNSGVVHAGVYYAPGSLKATLCRRGASLLKEFCSERHLTYREIGKVVVARSDAELPALRELERRCVANGVPRVTWLDRVGLNDLEPNVVGIAALHSPTTAIVDYVAIANAFADDITQGGGQVRTNAKVTGINQYDDRVQVVVDHEVTTVDRLVSCAGLQSDAIARLAGDDRGPVIVPFRGEYYRLVPGRESLVRGLVYPVPDPAYPFLGVHLTPRVSGVVEIGPNAVLATAIEGYRRRDISAGDLTRILGWPGTRRLLRQHWRAGVRELRGSLSRHSYLNLVREYVPSLDDGDVMPAPAGVRAQAVDLDGSLVEDFRVSQLGAVTAVRNAPSPAATSCLAIAEHIVGQLRG